MKTKRIKSAIPIYGCAALWLLVGLILPRLMLKGIFLLMMAALTVGVYLVLSKKFPGREVEVRDAANSGDKNVDATIEQGRRQLDQLRAANEALPDPVISKQLDRMVKAGEEIFKALEHDTSQLTAVRRFMNYYLPTADKLMNSYRLMNSTANRGENIDHAMKSVENSLDMIASAFEKQVDNLYKDKSLDVETDIQVMETMLAGDGLIGKGSITDTLSQAAGQTQADGSEPNDQSAQAGN